MAEIPTLESTVAPSVQPGGDLPLVASEGAYGGDVAQAIGGIGREANAQHQEAMRAFNQTNVLDAMNQAHEHAQKSVFDPQKGLLAQQTGKAARRRRWTRRCPTTTPRSARSATRG